MSIESLRELLDTIPPGRISDAGILEEVESQLADCWDKFADTSDHKMTGEKLDRMEDVGWEPPWGIGTISSRS